MMVDLHAQAWFTIAGRGRVASVDLRQLPNCPERIADNSELPVQIGQRVKIDGSMYEIRGIECTRAMMYPPSIKPNVGLVVKPVPRQCYDTLCVIIAAMFYKTMGIVCDADCGAETECQGRDATMAEVTAQAREEGWAISSAGHYCPEHRGRTHRSMNSRTKAPDRVRRESVCGAAL